MSYLDGPRILFAGTFQASPATINNTPNNYNPANYNQNTLKAENIELYWEPKGDSIFNLLDCQVTATTGTGDALVGSQVAALYTSSPPKLVDLDPMQQNGSEIWGMTVMLGDFTGAYVQGAFTPVAFNGIWGNSQGPNTPRNSASGSAVYQSTLTNLKWNVGTSAVLQRLQAISPNRLSIRLVVSAHNNAPQMYVFTDATFSQMAAQGVPSSVLDRIAPLKVYYMNLGGNGKPADQGSIPTVEYVNYLLAQLLDQGSLNEYGPRILGITKQVPYQPWIDYSTGQPLPEQPLFDFNYGKVVGAVGPCLDDEPAFAVPARTLAPVPAQQRQTTSTPPPSPPPPAGWWAQAKLDLEANPPSLTLDLANSLPVRLPGRPLWQEQLGTLSLAYYIRNGDSTQYVPIVKSIPYTDPDFIDKQSGILVVTDFGSVDPRTLAGLPLAVMRTVTVNGAPQISPFLEECADGWSLRADQFIYRMNPGLPTTASFAQGDTNTVTFYVRKFGQVAGTEAATLGVSILSPSEASNYTLSTLGTSGTRGIDERNLSVPPNKLIYATTQLAVQDGMARVAIRGVDPGNPRGYVDGQVYFTTYNFSPPVTGFFQDPNDIISVQIYQQSPITGQATWTNGIGDILRQYGMLYPIMGQFELWTYQGVCENSAKIQRVLGLDISQPLHMPASRDLSAIRAQLVLNWFAAGMPYGQIGPAGGPGNGWNNLPEVATWGAMTGLVIRAGDIIDAVAPVYGSRTATAAGGSGGTANQLDFTGDPIVALTGLTGTYFGATQVAQLSVVTAAGRTYGPFGAARNVSSPQPFDLRAPAGGRINSLFGTTAPHSGGEVYVAAIGGNVIAL